MPRQPRVHAPGSLYHAILRGNHRQTIFTAEDDYLAFEEILCAALERYGARLHAYCWMPNHVHLAIQVSDPPLGRIMHLLASRYARLKQKMVPTTGHLFERRYRAKVVAADQYLLTLVRYIHLNPVRAGLAADPTGYQWSSHRAYLGTVSVGWLEVALTLGLFDPSRAVARIAYQRFMADQPGDDEIAHIHPGGDRPWAGPGPPAARLDWPAASTRSGVPRDLEAIVHEVACELGVDPADLASPRRLPRLVSARREIARRAIREGVATLSEVASRLRRAPSSLSELLANRGRQ